jgi:hypothetical protein
MPEKTQRFFRFGRLRLDFPGQLLRCEQAEAEKGTRKLHWAGLPSNSMQIGVGKSGYHHLFHSFQKAARFESAGSLCLKGCTEATAVG